MCAGDGLYGAGEIRVLGLGAGFVVWVVGMERLGFGEQGDELALGMAACVHAGNDFLAEIAALGKTDARVDDAGFGGE